MRQLQFTSDAGEKRIIPLEEAKEIVKRIITTKMAMDCLLGGIHVIADGGRYELLGAEEEYGL